MLKGMDAVQKDGSPGKQEGNASTLAEAIEDILAMAGQEKVVLASTRSREPGHGCSVELQRATDIEEMPSLHRIDALFVLETKATVHQLSCNRFYCHPCLTGLHSHLPCHKRRMQDHSSVD